MQRKLTTIMCSDVIGYSKLISENELLTLTKLKECRLIIDKLIERYDGRIFNTAGDAVLAEFSSPSNAVRFAVEMQNTLYKRNQTQKLKIRFRIGLHLGEVAIDGNDLLGDAINIGARIESKSDLGGVSMSETVYAQIYRTVTEFKYHDRGYQSFKNIPNPIKIYSIEIEGSELNPNAQSVSEENSTKSIEKQISASDIIKEIQQDTRYSSATLRSAQQARANSDWERCTMILLNRSVKRDIDCFRELCTISVDRKIPESLKLKTAIVLIAGIKNIREFTLQEKVADLFADNYFGSDLANNSIKIWQLSAEGSDAAAIKFAKHCFSNENIDTASSQVAISSLERVARRKNIEAIFLLGENLINKKKLYYDLRRGFHWLWIARSYGELRAQLQLEVITQSISRDDFNQWKLEANALASEIY